MKTQHPGQGKRKHPLAHWDARKHAVDPVRRGFAQEMPGVDIPRLFKAGARAIKR
jgi:hypothetical protein